MKNLAQAFATLQDKGSFIFDINHKDTEIENKIIQSLIEDTGRHFTFGDEVNFNANLKAYIFENSVMLCKFKRALFVTVNKGVVYFSVCEYK